MKRLIFSLFVTLVVLGLPAINVFAGLGETMEQTTQHYGAVVKTEQSTHLPANEAGRLYEFLKDGFRIQERFVNGKVAWVLYLKDDRPIYETEIRTLLDNNAEGSTWSAGSEKPDRFQKKKVVYSRADSLADAEYNELNTYHGLLIITSAWRHATSQTSGL